MKVEVIQYLQPDGRQEKVWMDDLPDDLKPFLLAIKKAKCRLAVEKLGTGDISLTIEHKKGDVAIEICDNGPGENSPRVALERLIRSFTAEKFKWFLHDQEQADDGCGIGWGT